MRAKRAYIELPEGQYIESREARYIDKPVTIPHFVEREDLSRKRGVLFLRKSDGKAEIRSITEAACRRSI